MLKCAVAKYTRRAYTHRYNIKSNLIYYVFFLIKKMFKRIIEIYK
jgi:hypothetical protein